MYRVLKMQILAQANIDLQALQYCYFSIEYLKGYYYANYDFRERYHRKS